MLGGLIFQFIGALLRYLYNRLAQKEKRSFQYFYNGDKTFSDIELVKNDSLSYSIGLVFLLIISIIIVVFSL